MDDILDQYGDGGERGGYYNRRVEELRLEGYSFPIFQYISQAFDVFLKWPAGFVGFCLSSFLISALMFFLPLVGQIGSLLVSAPLGLGYAIVTSKILAGEAYEFADFFQAFEQVVQLFLATLISSIFIGIGMIFLLIPGIYIGVAYGWANLFIYFGKMEFWPALELSRKVITRQWFDLFLFFIVIVGLNLAGALVLGVGLLVTVPVSGIALYLSFLDIMEEE